MASARGTWWGVLAAWALSALLVFGAVGIGLRIPLLRRLDPLPEGSLLDYSRAPYGVFAPLRADFVASVLGFTTPDGEDASRRGADVAFGPATVVPVGASGGALPVPDVLTPGWDGELTFPPPRPPEHPPPRPPAGDGRPVNDNFHRAAQVWQVPFSADGDTGRATRQDGEPAGCAPLGGTVWYRYTAAGDGGMVAHTVGSNHPTSVGVFTGDRLSDLQQVGCDSDPRGNARVAFLADAGTTYHLQVSAPVVGGRLRFALEFVGSTTRASVSSAGAEGDHRSGTPFISGDGRWLAFTSDATTLDQSWRQPRYFEEHSELRGGPVPTEIWDVEATPYTCRQHAALAYTGDSVATTALAGRPCNPMAYVRDRLTHKTVLVSVSTDGEQPRGFFVWNPVVSADGRHVSFTSDADNIAELPEGTYGGQFDVFVRDRDTDADGVFDEPGAVRTVRVSDNLAGEPQEDSFNFGGISEDRRYVAFYSDADHLVDDTNEEPDVFVRDRDADGDGVFDEPDAVTVERISVSSDEVQARGGSILNCMSRDGRYVAFRSTADNLVDGDTNGVMDTFVRDRVTGRTERTSLTWDGGQQNADSAASTGGTPGCLSEETRYHVFASAATNLVPDDNNEMVDLFVRDRIARTTVRVSMAWDGAEATTGDLDPTHPESVPAEFGCYRSFTDACDTTTVTGHSMSRDGRLVVFSSPAVNLVADDGNGAEDVFVRDRDADGDGVFDEREPDGVTTYRVSVPSAGEEANLWSTIPRISANGRFVSFSSLASNLIEGDTNATEDVFVRELPGPWGPSGWR